MNKTKSLKRTVSLLLVMVMLAAELVTPIGAIVPSNLLSSGSSTSMEVVDENDLSGTDVGTLTDTGMTNYDDWKDSQNAKVSIQEDADGKYINVYDNDVAVAPKFHRENLDMITGIKTITFDLRVNAPGTNATDASMNGAIFELKIDAATTSASGGTGVVYPDGSIELPAVPSTSPADPNASVDPGVVIRLYFGDTLSIQYGSSGEVSDTGIIVPEGEWAKVILVTTPADTFSLYYANEKLVDSVSTIYGRDFSADTDLFIYSESATAGSDFDIKNYAVYNGNVSESLLPTPDPSVPIDTIDLSEKELGLLTDTNITNYSSWNKSENASVSVKEEDGQKYLNALDNDAEKLVAIQRHDIDFRTGVKTISFDLRINDYGTSGVSFELYDTQVGGTSCARISLNEVISYYKGKSITKLQEGAVLGKWVSVIAVIDGDNNTYSFYYNGAALFTNEAPRMNTDGTLRNFYDRLLDIEIRSEKTDDSCDFDVRNFAIYTGDASERLLPTPDPNAPIDTIDLSEKELGLLTDKKMTNYSSWKEVHTSCNVTVKEENGQKYLNALDNNAEKLVAIQRHDVDFRTGVKTISFDLRINDFGNSGVSFELYDTQVSGTSCARISLNKAISYYKGKSLTTLQEGAVPGKWASVIMVIDGDNNTYSFYYNGAALFTNEAPRSNNDDTLRNFYDRLLDIEIRSEKADDSCDFDVRNFAIYTGDRAASLLEGYTPVVPDPLDPNVPVDTIDLSKKEVGLLTDLNITNYDVWKDSETRSVNVKEESGQKYLNIVDNDPNASSVIYRNDIDFRTGVKTISFDMRVNELGNKGPVLQIYDRHVGGSCVRIEFFKTITYAKGKGLEALDENTPKDIWISIVLVIDGDNNTYSFYYNGAALFTNEAPRSGTDGVQRNFYDRLYDIEIGSEKAGDGCDFDVRNFVIYTGDRSKDLAWHVEIPEPEYPKDELGLPVYDTIDLSKKEVGVLTDTSMTNYSAWKDTQDRKVTVKEENGQKYLNIVDNNSTRYPAFQRWKLDFRKGVKTIVFDMRINSLGEKGQVEIELYDINNGGSMVRLMISEDEISYALTSKGYTKTGDRAIMNEWATVIIVVDAETNTYSFFYGGKEVLYEVPPRDDVSFGLKLLDLEIRGDKAGDEIDFDIRNYRTYTGNQSYTLLGMEDPNLPVDVNNAGTKGTPGKAISTYLGLPYSDNYKWSKGNTINTSAYDNYLAKRADLAASTTAAGGSANEVKILEPVAVRGAVEVYVSPDGNDKNNGSKQKPLKTLQRAMAFIAELEAAGAQGVVVYLREGTYQMERTVSITAKHSGKNNIPVIISAYPNEKVVLTGGMDIAGSKFTAVTDEAVLKKLQDSVEDKIVAFDLKTLGLTEFGFISGYHATSGPNYSVQINGENLTLARYPNFENIPLSRRVIDPGPVYGEESNSTGTEFVMADRRPLQWENDGNIWFKGSLFAEWRVHNQRVAEIREGTRSVKLEAETTGDGQYYNRGAITDEKNTHYYYNILEELDIPGEYYLDTTNGILYLYPTCDMSTATVTYTQMRKNLFDIKNASNVVLNGLNLENTSGIAIKMYNCKQVIVQNCNIQNVGQGVVISGEGSGVIYSNITYCDGFAVSFVDTHLSRNNFLQNCSISTGDITKAKSHEISVTGKGHVVSHNLVKDSYNCSIFMNEATECVVEYNEVVGGPTGSNDSGSIYQYSGGEIYNNHVRFNYIHDTGTKFDDTSDPWAIYFDDASCGSFAYGNIIQNTAGGLFTNSGSSHVFVDNVVVNGRAGTNSGVNGSDNYADRTWEAYATGNFASYQRALEQYKTDAAFRAELINQSPAMARRLQLAWDIEKKGGDSTGIVAARENYAVNNIIANHEGIRLKGLTETHVIKNNTILDEDPFVDSKNHDFTLKSGVTLSEGTVYVAPDMSRMGIIGVKQTISPIEGYLPEDGAQTVNPSNILFRWFGGDGADSFEVTIAKDKGLTVDVKTVTVNAKACSLIDDDYFDFDTTYYWTIKGLSVANSVSNNELACAHVYSFKTMTYEEYMEENGADVTGLAARIEEAKALLAEIKEIAEGGPYFYGTKAALQVAIEKAEAIVAIGRQQIQDDVDDAELELRNSIKKAKISRPMQHVTLPQFVLDEWVNYEKSGGTMYTTLVGDELILTNTSRNDWVEVVHATPLGDRDMIHFQFMVDRLEDGVDGSWVGIVIGQTDLNSWYGRDGNEGYHIVIKENVFEFQMEEEILITADNNVLRPGQWHEIQMGALKNSDGTVRVVFAVDGQIIFNYLDFSNTTWSGTNGFGFCLRKESSIGSVHVKRSENLEHELADYTALDEEIAKEPANGASIYSERTWSAYLAALNAAKNMPRDLSIFDQQAVDDMTKALKEAREALLTPEQEAALEAGKDPGEKGDNSTIIIVVACVAGVAVLAGAVVLILTLRKRRALKATEQAEGETEEAETGETETV